MNKKMVCVACPIGCPLEVEVNEKGEAISITGNTCKRGETYARSEITNPTRSLTTTVKLLQAGKPVVPLSPLLPFPKEGCSRPMKVINKTQLKAPVHIGEVAVKNILDTGIDIVVTNNDTGR